MRDDREGARPQIPRDPVDMTLRPATPQDLPAILALNLESERFHRGFGFIEVGRQSVAGGQKQVSLQAAPVRSDG